MSISKRKTKRGEDRFDVLYRGPDGRERSRTFRTRRDARAFESEERVAMRKGVWTDPKAGKVTLAEWATDWHASAVHLSDRTSQIYADNIRLHVLPPVVDRDGKEMADGLGPFELGQLTTAQLTAWVAALSRKPRANARSGVLSPASVHQAYRVLHLCLESAVACGMIGRNQLDGVKPPRVEAKPARFLEPAEVDALADAIDHRYRAMVLVAAYCGLRMGELLALRWENVDLLGRAVQVVEQVDTGGPPGAVKPPKTAAGRRSVPMPTFVAETLASHGRTSRGPAPGRPGGGAALVAVPDNPGPHGAIEQAAAWSGLVFQAPRGGPIDRDKWRARFWVPALRAAGLDPLRFHDLRHTCASLAIRAGADVKVLQRMLGHASAAVTLDTYGHLMPGQAEAVADRLDELHAAAVAGAS